MLEENCHYFDGPMGDLNLKNNKNIEGKGFPMKRKVGKRRD